MAKNIKKWLTSEVRFVIVVVASVIMEPRKRGVAQLG